MAAYIARRVAQGLVVIMAVLGVVFFVGNVIGDPVDIMLPIEATVEQREALREQLGFGDSVWDQFKAFVSRVVTDQFGNSLWQRIPALDIVMSRLPLTLYLTFVTLSFSVPVALLLGVLAAAHPRSVLDRIIGVWSYLGISTVEFWLGLMLIMVFAVQLGWLPSGGSGGIAHVVLPAVAIGYRSIGRLSQLTRSAVLDELSKPYIAVARGKGMPEWRVYLHALKNAAIPVVTLLGDEVNTLASGQVVVETVFSWPGLGLLLLQAIEQRDLFLVEATAFVLACLVVVVNLTVDACYAWLDPRIRYS